MKIFSFYFSISLWFLHALNVNNTKHLRLMTNKFHEHREISTSNTFTIASNAKAVNLIVLCLECLYSCEMCEKKNNSENVSQNDPHHKMNAPTYTNYCFSVHFSFTQTQNSRRNSIRMSEKFAVQQQKQQQQRLVRWFSFSLLFRCVSWFETQC